MRIEVHHTSSIIYIYCEKFSIRITNDARDTVAFSWLRTVTVRLGSTKVSLLQKMRVKVDGKKVTLPYIKLGVLSVMRDGYRVILRTNEGRSKKIISKDRLYWVLRAF